MFSISKCSSLFRIVSDLVASSLGIEFKLTQSRWQHGNNGSTELSNRPPPTAVVVDNTTAISVTGSWVQTQNSDIGVAYRKYNRIVNNITMSMPHSGVFAAARDRKNDILQPEDLAGVGEYSLRAAVVSPTINVLCVNMKATEMDPLIYVRWPDATTIESTNFPTQKLAWYAC